MNPRPDDALLALYDAALARHGDTAQGALWPDEQDRQRRYDVMLDVLAGAPAGQRVLLCDLACGTGGLLARLRERGLDHVDYRGVDRSAEAIRLARAKFPEADFRVLDPLDDDADLAALDCDYLVANGLFTVRGTLSESQMQAFLQRVLALAWPHVRRGLAFNVMSTVVDWRREDLFHAPMDDIARLLHGLAGRRVRMRADYGLYEYTSYAWRDDLPSDLPPRREPDTAADAPIPVLRPRLPAAERLLPYLRRIDAARVYSNFGPLVLEFERRLAGLLGVPTQAVVTANSGTAGLVACVLALAGRATAQRPLALLPAYTFVATAVAAQECGYEPLLADIRGEDWQLDPLALAAHPRLGEVGVVMPVAPYGRLVDPAPWRAFEARTGIPVVIDGAASLEPASADGARWLGAIPVVFSLHATKGLATGEGGAIACTDPARIERIGQALNFGFNGSRESRAPSTNGKMSEYHAAVGLAELDGWPLKSAALACVAATYRRLAEAAGLGKRVWSAPDLCSSYVLFDAGDAEASQRVQAALERRHVGFRLWYGLGLQAQPSFADCPADPLPVTASLAPRLLGLPMAPDLDHARIARVIAALAESVR
jgi:dTDP-4-amino-4,6-dideoxygalactose transaminase